MELSIRQRLASWISGKAQTDANKVISSSISVWDRDNPQGKPRPFNYHAAVQQYRGWVYAAARLNAVAVAQTPLRMYVRKRGGEKLVNGLRKVSPQRKRYFRGDKLNAKGLRFGPSDYVMNKAAEWADEFEEVTEQTQILKLLKRPSPWVGGFEFSVMRMTMLQLTGNFYMHPILESARISEKSHTRIKELWVVPSQFVTITPGSGEDWIKDYIYGVNTSVQRHFAPDEIKHLKLPNPENHFYGMGVVEAGWPVLKLSNAQREEDQAKKDNQSRPDLAVITESANVTVQQLNEYQNEWARLFRGTFRSGSPVFLTGKTQVIPLNWVPTEIGDREITVEEIAAVTGVPVSMLKANDPNLASAQVGFASWRENTTLPYCRMDEEFLNNSIMPIYGIEDDAFLAYDNPVPENREEIRADITAFVGAGVWSRNEGRNELGDADVDEENAGKLLVPAGLQPIDKVGEMPSMGPLNFTMGGSHDDGNDSAGRGKAAPLGLRGSDDSRTRRPNVQHDDKGNISQFRHIYARHKGDADDTARTAERERPILAAVNRLNGVFAKQSLAVRRGLTGEMTQSGKAVGDILPNDIKAILAQLREFDADIADAIAPLMTMQMVAGGVAGLDQINLPSDAFSVMNPKVSEFIDKYTIRLAGEINDYSIRLLSEELGKGIAAGESTGELAQRVGATFDDFTGYRSEMIARTESARAYSAGTEQSWVDSGVVEKKKWLLASAACPICLAISRLHPEGIPLDTPFAPLGASIALGDGRTFSVDYATIMGPPGHPHCRCGTSAVLKEE